MNEPELIRRCLKREKEGWDIFVRKYSRLIYWAIRKRLNISGFVFDEEDVKCIFQEVFLSILGGQKLSQLRDVNLISGWLAMVASNKTVDFMREKIRDGKRFASDPAVLGNNQFQQELFDRELIDIVENIIDTLSAKEKVVITLNLFEGRTHKEIAHILGISVNTVSTIIARTKGKLKEELRKKGIKDNQRE